MIGQLHPPAIPRELRRAIELRAREAIRRSAEARRAWKREHRTPKQEGRT